MKTRRRKDQDPIALARQLLELLIEQAGEKPDEPAIDREAIRARAERAAERMRRARR